MDISHVNHKPYYILPLTGRCANGAEGGHGRIYHAVKNSVALCGAEPGRHSAGWSTYEGEAVTCPACLKKLERDA